MYYLIYKILTQFKNIYKNQITLITATTKKYIAIHFKFMKNKYFTIILYILLILLF